MTDTNALAALVRYHETGGHEGDGSAETLAAAKAELAALRATDHPHAEDCRNRAERAEQALAERDAEQEAAMQNDDALVERIARIIDPSSWAVMDSYLAQTKRKYRGQNVGWPSDQFQDKDSMSKARAILAVLPQYTGAAEVTEADVEAWERYGPMIFYAEITGPEVLAKVRAAGFAAGAAEMRERAETAVHNALIAFASAEANATPDAMYSAAVSAIAALPKEPQP